MILIGNEKLVNNRMVMLTFTFIMFSCALLLFLTAFSLIALGQEPLDYNQVIRSVVRIKAEDGNNIGSGTVIKVQGGKLYILTAYHVIQQDLFHERNVKIELFSEEKEISAQLSRRNLDVANDLALIVAESPRTNPPPAIKWGSSISLRATHNVYALGHPMSTMPWLVTQGFVSRLHGGKIYFSGGAVAEGSSGGPLLNDKWEMVGINLQKEGTIGKALSSDIIKEIVRTWITDHPSPNRIRDVGKPTEPASSPKPPPRHKKPSITDTRSEQERQDSQIVDELTEFLTEDSN